MSPNLVTLSTLNSVCFKFTFESVILSTDESLLNALDSNCLRNSNRGDANGDVDTKVLSGDDNNESRDENMLRLLFGVDGGVGVSETCPFSKYSFLCNSGDGV